MEELQDVFSNFDHLKKCLLTFRNCSIDPQAGPFLIKQRILTCCSSIAENLARSRHLPAVSIVDVKELLTDENQRWVIRTICQFFGNATSASTIVCNYLCQELRMLSHLFAASVKVREVAALAAVLHVAYNLMCSSKEDADTRLQALLEQKHQWFWRQLFLSLSDAFQLPIVPTDSQQPAGQSDEYTEEQSQLFDWMLLTNTRLISAASLCEVNGMLRSSQAEGGEGAKG
ncbi:hypothetical protein EON64_13885, partial [archaeon]